MTITMICPTTKDVTVSFKTAAMLPAFGDAAADLSDPSIISASITGATTTTATMKLTPLKNGTTALTVYAGGPSASQRAAVTVAGCP